MHLRTKRIIAGVLLASLMGGVVYGELYLTPSTFFASPIYWFGLGVYTLAGALFVTESNKTWRYFGGGVVVTGLALLIASQKYPPALVFVFGFPGLFIGMSIRAAYVFFIQGK